MLHPNSQAATHGADKDREKGDAPSGRSAASFLPRDNSILGSSSATHSTRHVASVTFWNVDMAIPKGKVPPLRWETSFVAGLWRRAQDVVPPSSLLTGGAQVTPGCEERVSPLRGAQTAPLFMKLRSRPTTIQHHLLLLCYKTMSAPN